MFFTKLISKHARFISSLIDHLSYSLLPPTCLLCGSPTNCTSLICIRCQHDLPILPHLCPQCAQIISGPTHQDLLCGQCLIHPPPFDRTYALFPYEFPIIQLIIQLKFQHQLSHAEALGKLLARSIQTKWYVNQSLPDKILPIPLHPTRLRQRGFNQALEIAKPISKALSIPIDRGSIQRIKSTAAQSTLPASARKQNIANAFKVHRDYSGLTLAVIDDVMTTGFTMAECCRMLKLHGAKRIDVWCCARRMVHD